MSFNEFELVAEFKAKKSALNLLNEKAEIPGVLAGLKVGLYNFMKEHPRCPSNDEFFDLLFNECQHPRIVENSSMTTTTTNEQQTDNVDDCTSKFSTASTTSEPTSNPVVSAQADHLSDNQLFISEEPQEKIRRLDSFVSTNGPSVNSKTKCSGVCLTA
jgi:hypothetical protein